MPQEAAAITWRAEKIAYTYFTALIATFVNFGNEFEIGCCFNGTKSHANLSLAFICCWNAALPTDRPFFGKDTLFFNFIIKSFSPQAHISFRPSVPYSEPVLGESLLTLNYQEPRVGVQHCGVKLRDSAEEVRKGREQFPLPMLIRASGNPAFVRLVKPSCTSVNEWSSFLLATEKRLIVYNGNEATISSRSKIAQIAYEIVASKELPTNADRVEIANDDRKTECHFWRVLERDEENETKMEKENLRRDCSGAVESFEGDKVFEARGDGTIAILSEGRAPESALFDQAKVLLFYFISEIYVWVGSNANKSLVENAVNFAQSLKDCPLVESARRVVCQNDQSPMGWMIMRRMPEGIIDTLFKHKFSNWTNHSRKKKSFPQRPMSVPSNPKIVSKMLQENASVKETAQRMTSQNSAGAELRLEDNILRPEDKNVFTEGLRIFGVVGESLRETDQPISLVQFEADKCYVIEWEYRVERTGIRKLDGSVAERRECGRRRKCFFYWLGPDSTIADQSHCALTLRERDTERCEHIRVEAGKEAPMLLHLLGGLVVWGTGSGILCVIGSSGHCYVAQEMHSAIQYRSQGVYLRILDGRIECLGGDDCPDALLQSAQRLANKLADWKGLKAAKKVIGLRENVAAPVKWTKAPKMFRFYENELWEMSCAHPKANFTFRQRELRDCVVVDQGSRLWIWTESDLLVPTFVLKVAFFYWYREEFSLEKSVDELDASAHLIYGGSEPDEFKALFVEWEGNGSEENSNGRRTEKLKAVMAERLKLRSVDELRRKDLSPGCDTKHLEEYLSEDDFGRVFGVSREQFEALPRWRQLTLKKKVGLF
uniref:HP domain-containing protein n=1 Tax=Globodera rostochiensis TaxID=31243 RepID=A0A914HH76_GLORO